MPASEAQLKANQANAKHSTGPKSPEGKAISSQNSLKHGLTSQDRVLAKEDLAELELRVDALEASMRPCSPEGQILIRQMATCSLFMEKAAHHEIIARARNVRNAAVDFDAARISEAEALFDTLGEHPKRILRKLRRSPEGVDCLIDAWQELRENLHRDPKPNWVADSLVQAANMTGVRGENARGSRLGALSRGFWGDFFALGDSEGGELDDEARQLWCKDRLIERIDVEIAELEAHRLTLDFEMIELDRAEAGGRALFDASKPACLARRYRADAERSFYKAHKEFRQVEAEALAKGEWASPPVPEASPDAKLGSFREQSGPVPAEFDMDLLKARRDEVPTMKGPDGQPIKLAKSVQPPA